jgi:hypothetical protein
MDWTRLQLLAMGSNQKDVIKGRVFLFTSCTNASSCQEWRQQVELEFESLKCPINEWWDEYIIWIQSVIMNDVDNGSDERTNPNSLRHGNKRTTCLKTTTSNNMSLTN